MDLGAGEESRGRGESLSSPRLRRRGGRGRRFPCSDAVGGTGAVGAGAGGPVVASPGVRGRMAPLAWVFLFNFLFLFRVSVLFCFIYFHLNLV